MLNPEFIENTLLIFAIGLARMLAAFTMIPFFSKEVMGGGMLRNGVAMSLSLFMFPVVQEGYRAQELLIQNIIALLLKEIVIGLLIGYVVSIIFWSIESVGFFIDNQRGATMAGSINPLSGSQTSPLGVFLSQALNVIFFSSGAFLILLGSVYSSYKVWPVFSYYPSFNYSFVEFSISMLDHLMYLTVLFSAPVIIAMFFAEFGLALVGRFAPQMDVFFLAMPIKSAISIAVLIVYVGVVLILFKEQLQLIDIWFFKLRDTLVP